MFSQQIIMSSDPDSSLYALEEIKVYDPSAWVIQHIEAGVDWVQMEETWEELCGRIALSPPIFTRHIHPVHTVVKLSLKMDDIKKVQEAVTALYQEAGLSGTFSVQCRMMGDKVWPYGRFDLNTAAAESLTSLGAELNVQAPEVIVSVVCDKNSAFIGISKADENLSNWAGGEQRFKRYDQQASRSAFKLLEAIDVFDIEIPKNGRVLDMGAAPGGWSQVMAAKGCMVVAVDPAALDDRLAGNTKIKHERKLIQAYLRENPAPFDLILNDMRMDLRESCYLMIDAKKFLVPGGTGVMTMKLSNQQSSKEIHLGLGVLSDHFEIIGARQLFHNRQEVTVVFRQAK